MSHVCVSTTARQAAQRGYDVLVAEDAIGDRDVPGASAEQLVQVRIASAFCGPMGCTGVQGSAVQSLGASAD